METKYSVLRRPKTKLCYITEEESPPKHWEGTVTLEDVDRTFDDSDSDISFKLRRPMKTSSPISQNMAVEEEKQDNKKEQVVSTILFGSDDSLLESPPSKIVIPKMSGHKEKPESRGSQESAQPPVHAVSQAPEVSTHVGKARTDFLQKLKNAGQSKVYWTSPFIVPTPPEPEDDFMILEDPPFCFSITSKSSLSKKQRHSRTSSTVKDSSEDKRMKDRPLETPDQQQESEKTKDKLEVSFCPSDKETVNCEANGKAKQNNRPVVSERSSSEDCQVLGKRKRKPPREWWLSCPGSTEETHNDQQSTQKKSKQKPEEPSAGVSSPAKAKEVSKKRNQKRLKVLPVQQTSEAEKRQTNEEFMVAVPEQSEQQEVLDQEECSPLMFTQRDLSLNSVFPSTRSPALLSVSDFCAPPLKPLILLWKDKANLTEWFKSRWQTTPYSDPGVTPDQFDWYFYQYRALGLQVELSSDSFCSGKIVLGSVMKTPLRVDHGATTVFNLLTSSVKVTIDGCESCFSPGKSFVVEYGHAYTIQNLTAQPAVLYFTKIFAGTDAL